MNLITNTGRERGLVREDRGRKWREKLLILIKEA